jgi:hypothetical protein
MLSCPSTEHEAGIKVHRGREYKKPETRDRKLKTNLKGKSDKNVNVSDVMNKNNTAVLITDLKLYYYQYSTSIGWVLQMCVKEPNQQMVLWFKIK